MKIIILCFLLPVSLFALPIGLVGHWQAEGNTLDSSTYHNDGSLYGNATYGEGPYGQSFVFDGDMDSVVVPDSPSFNNFNNITISTWFKAERFISTRQSLVSFKEGADVNVGAVLALPEGNGNHVRQWIQINGDWRAVDTVTTLSLNQWYHVAGTYDGTAIRIYINGVLDNEVYISGSMNNAPGNTYSNIVLGGRACNQTHWFDGEMDEVQIYNRALNLSEIQLTMVVPEVNSLVMAVCTIFFAAFLRNKKR